MRVLLATHGSTGDIYPVIALGRALREVGHSVTLATSRLYRPDIERAGLTFHRVPPDWDEALFAEFMRELDRQPHPLLQLRAIYEGSVPFANELLDSIDAAVREHDVLIASYLFPHLKVLAERHNVPFGVFTFCHNVVPSRTTHPEAFPSLPWLNPENTTLYNRITWRLANVLVDWTINDVIGQIFDDRSLPPQRNFFLKPADLALVAVSKTLMEPKGVHPRFQFVGFLRFQAAENAALEKDLVAFCEGERVPILTFGSVSFDDVHRLMARFERHWPRGQKMILQSGWAGLSLQRARPELKLIGKLSHDQLFRHASCVIHHGGAGTTASVLAAGVPQVVVPHIADQHFWASEVERLGCGVTIHKKRWPEQLPGAVAKVTGDARMKAMALQRQAEMNAENGRARSVEVIEAFVAAHREGRLPEFLVPQPVQKRRFFRRKSPPAPATDSASNTQA